MERMKKLIRFILAVTLMAALSLGCASAPSKENKIKCPKCGAPFTIDEGIRNFGIQQPYGP